MTTMRVHATPRFISGELPRLPGFANVVISDSWSFTAPVTDWELLRRSPIRFWEVALAQHESAAVPLGSLATIYTGEKPLLELEFDPRWP